MSATPPLQPTLWRTCRALANRVRLKLFQFLAENPGQTVSAVAARLKVPLPVASQYLRALEARGLLANRRVGLRVIYRLGGETAGSTQGLATVLRSALKQKPAPIEMIFKTATAFTHPRRIEIYGILSNEPKTLAELRLATGFSARALVRHLTKLESRGFVALQHGRYLALKRHDALGQELARMARG